MVCARTCCCKWAPAHGVLLFGIIYERVTRILWRIRRRKRKDDAAQSYTRIVKKQFARRACKEQKLITSRGFNSSRLTGCHNFLSSPRRTATLKRIPLLLNYTQTERRRRTARRLGFANKFDTPGFCLVCSHVLRMVRAQLVQEITTCVI